MRLIFLGPPGAGKGTQAQKVADILKIAKISTGDILREAVRHGTPLGLEAKGFMDAGALVPDDVVIGMIRERMKEPDCQKGFILDGFPRTLEQAESLKKMLDENGVAIQRVLNFELPEEELVKRLSGRRSCPRCKAVYNLAFQRPKQEGVCDQCGSPLIQRSDDEPETIRKRFSVYEKQTSPLIHYYDRQGLLRNINASGGTDDVFQRVMKTIREQ
jgi:adenylate kinase